MATNYINLKGTLKWAKVYEPDNFSGSEFWSVNFYPQDGAEWEKFHKSGMQLKVNEDKDGVSGKFVKFRRLTKRVFEDEIVKFCPPEITGKVNVSYQTPEGNKVRQYNKSEKITVDRVGDPTPLGNGTLAIVNVSVFDTAKGKGHRLENINVLDLVVYESSTKDEAGPAEDEKPVTADKVADTKAKLDDDLPW